MAAFHAALDRETRDAELDGWMLDHLLQCQKDYLQPPANGAWPSGVSGPDVGAPGVLVEQSWPPCPRESKYNETTAAALHLLHRLLLAQPGQIRHVAPVYFAYHPLVEPATGMVLAPIVAGSFLMGSPDDGAGTF